MKSETKYIILNSKHISAEEISKFATENTTDPTVQEWENDLYLFLNEWFSDANFVVAQTSGSTGEPKPIKLSKALMKKSAERTIGYFGLQKGARFLLSLSCKYIAGKMMVVRAIVGQMNLITVDPAGDFELLNEEIVDFGALVPNQVFKILEQPSGKEKLQNIRNLLIGGSAISSDLEKQLSSRSNRVVVTYGMTETASHIAIRELSGKLKSDFYSCLPGIKVSLNPEGCLQIQNPEFENPLQTNDLAELQSEISFRILGRADSIIISGGIKYIPEVLEKKLGNFLPQRLVISSVPDDKLGEKLALVIESKSFNTIEIEQKTNTLFTTYERPKLICFLDKFPETLSGKIIRDEVKKLISKR